MRSDVRLRLTLIVTVAIIGATGCGQDAEPSVDGETIDGAATDKDAADTPAEDSTADGTGDTQCLHNACNGTLFCDTSVSGQHKCKVDPKTIVTCPYSGKVCVANICQAKTGKCELSMAAAEGKMCPNEGAYITNSRCKSGSYVGNWSCQCSPHQPNSCASKEDGNQCNGTMACTLLSAPPVHVCTIDKSTIVNCSTAKDTARLKSSCVTQSGTCQMEAVGDGTGCDDGNTYTTGDVCKTGVCKGSPKGGAGCP
ncbi:MAG: hypothetical protein KC502_23415 [Myxococcales bacterium]|nr:hypothetical protein [Myxococcales bacterium]